jgi:hypothetical protein
MSGARTLAVGALALILGSCGGLDVTPTVNPTRRSTVPPGPTETPLEFLADVNADGFKEALVDTLNATCRDGDGTDDRMWTCSYRDEVAISFYGPSPAEVSAFRVVTDAPREVDRRSWLRGYASIISVEVFEWVYDHVGSNETAKVDGVWIQMTHDATSDGVLISAKDPGP